MLYMSWTILGRGYRIGIEMQKFLSHGLRYDKVKTSSEYIAE